MKNTPKTKSKMGFADFYFQKFSTAERKIKAAIPENLSCIITIPCFKEQEIIKALESLYFCTPTETISEVIVLLNYPENKKELFADFHRMQCEEISNWMESHQKKTLKFHVLLEELPEKDAGVGLARKIAMDEAVRRFQEIDNPCGIICGFDADCTCSSNYLTAIHECFKQPKINGCSIYFEHPVNGVSYEPEIYEAIVYYELYLRYYVEALKKVNFPYAFHTLGSSFGVTAEAYIRQGGMNKRKAGEDFYFLHKIIPMGGFAELNSCAVYPSPRTSDRVPFGTGAAVQKILTKEDFDFPTFCPKSFDVLKDFFALVPSFFNINDSELQEKMLSLHGSLQEFLTNQNFVIQLKRMNSQASHYKPFEKAFFNWFNGLMVLKFLNFSHERYFSKIPVSEAALKILELEIKEPALILEHYRSLQNPERMFIHPQR